MIERFRPKPVEPIQPRSEQTFAEKRDEEIRQIQELLKTIQQLRKEYLQMVVKDTSDGMSIPETEDAVDRMNQLVDGAIIIAHSFFEKAAATLRLPIDRFIDFHATEYQLAESVGKKNQELLAEGKIEEALNELRRLKRDYGGYSERIQQDSIRHIIKNMGRISRMPSPNDKLPYVIAFLQKKQKFIDIVPAHAEFIGDLMKPPPSWYDYTGLFRFSDNPIRLLEKLHASSLNQDQKDQAIHWISSGRVSERFVIDEPDSRMIEWILGASSSLNGNALVNYAIARPFVEKMMTEFPDEGSGLASAWQPVGTASVYGRLISKKYDDQLADFRGEEGVLGYLSLMVGEGALVETWSNLSIDMGLQLMRKALDYDGETWSTFFSTIFKFSGMQDKDRFLAEVIKEAPVQALCAMTSHDWGKMSPILKIAILQIPTLLDDVFDQPMKDYAYTNCIQAMTTSPSSIDRTKLTQKILSRPPETGFHSGQLPDELKKIMVQNPVFLERFIALQKTPEQLSANIPSLYFLFEGDRSVFRRIVLASPNAPRLVDDRRFDSLPEDIKTELLRRELGERGLTHMPDNQGIDREQIMYFLKKASHNEGAWITRLRFLLSAHEVADHQAIVIDGALQEDNRILFAGILNKTDHWERLPDVIKESQRFWELVARGKEIDFFRKHLDQMSERVRALPFIQPSVAYCLGTTIDDTATYQVFIGRYQSDGPEAAGDYLQGLREDAKRLIGGSDVVALRQRPEYLYLTKLVFADGNYSTYEKNIACGDKTEHLEEYKLDRAGYPVTMTGLLGYRITTESVPDNTTLYRSYESRLQGIRAFIDNRGPDNTALQAVFEKEVEQLFIEVAHPAFRSIEKLSTKEKMLALLITETVRGSKQKGSVPNPAILDLVVKFKYAYHENLEQYVQVSAQEVEQYTDKTSQRFVMWSELSTIYGENIKHVMRHSIFEELAEQGEQYEALVGIFGDLIGSQREAAQLTGKQIDRIKNTCNNEKIQPERRFGLLRDQARNMFATNIKFETSALREEFDTQLDAIVEPLRANTTVEAFIECVPALFRLRDRYRFGINAKLEEYMMRDYNLIAAEMAKFEEVIEVEAKETSMGGARGKEVKKSSKKRNIRGFFMKSQESTNARMGAYICIAGDKKMWENPNYFEFVEKDEDTGKCVGVAMLLNINAADGKRYLYFGPNPFESFLTQVRSEQAFDHMYEQVTQFAAANGYDGVVVPSAENAILGSCTNRGGNFPDLIKAKRLRKKDGGLQIVDFGEEHTLGHYGESAYAYKDGALIWQPQ